MYFYEPDFGMTCFQYLITVLVLKLFGSEVRSNANSFFAELQNYDTKYCRM